MSTDILTTVIPPVPGGWGWKPDRPDFRDHRFSTSAPTFAALPGMVDLRDQCPPIWDQGQLGSCTAHAIGAAVEYDRLKQGYPAIDPSRLFIYYNERAMEGTTGVDAGASIRDGIKSVNIQGVCGERLWPYDIRRFTQKPPPLCYQEAIKDRALTYRRVPQALGELQGCLASGYPIVFGFAVYSSFMTQQVARTGVAPIPSRRDRAMGGHAVLAVGYSEANQRFLCRNSWSEAWGARGYFTLPYAYMTSPQLASDLWTITTVAD
jgi:C1A family cysteine protease